MCQKLIEKYVCGDDETSSFPCEDFLDNGICDHPEEDKMVHKDKKCRECKYFDEALKRIAEDASLAPKPKRGGLATIDPNAPKRYYKEYIKWSKCGHLSHPKWTGIERFDDGPEIGFEIEGIGRCHGCAEADPRTLARMERNGELATPDPWGFMEAEPDVPAGSSASAGAEQMSNEAIAMGITDSALAGWRRRGSQPTGSGGGGDGGGGGGSVMPPPPPLPGYKTAMGGALPTGGSSHRHPPPAHHDDWSRSPSPEFHTGASKGKGRHGHADDTYASRYGNGTSPSDSDDNDDDHHHSAYSRDSPPPPPPRGRGRKPATIGHRHPHFPHDQDDAEDEEEEEVEARIPQHWGSGNRDLGERDGDGDGDEDAFVEILAAERRRLGIPAGMKLTAKGLGRFKERRGEEGRLAMKQNAGGS